MYPCPKLWLSLRLQFFGSTVLSDLCLFLLLDLAPYFIFKVSVGVQQLKLKVVFIFKSFSDKVYTVYGCYINEQDHEQIDFPDLFIEN